MFDDFLGLAGQSFDGVFLVVFVGESGSGKSTAMHYLETEHPSYAGRGCRWVRIAPGSSLSIIPNDAPIIFIDEIRSFGNLCRLFRSARRGARLVVASHVGGWAFLPFRLFGRVRIFRTDRAIAKLERYLQAQGVTFSAESLKRFASIYGATYTDLEIILERSGRRDFDAALRKFETFDRLTREDAH
jgi:hypothetical protein